LKRVILLLDPPVVRLTARQLANRKYKASEKGRAAMRRAKAKQLAKAEERAKKTARNRAWRQRNPMLYRVYNRTYMRRWRRERAVAAATA
jgi:hypothetical protein